MSIKIGEIGKEIYFGTDFDMSANTGLSLTFTFTPADGSDETTFTRSNPDVTAPAVPSPALPDLGIFAASTYFLYATQALDFTIAGDWCVYGTYTEGATKLYISDNGTQTIEEAC